MLKAVIFDCDGVIVDSEPLHLKTFQRVLADEGITLTQEAYNQTYLAMDDKGCFEAVLTAHNRQTDQAKIKRLIHQKMALYRASQQELHIYAGVHKLVKTLVGKVHLAIASGAFRGEIKFALDQAGIRSAFPVIVSAQDVKQGKPNPEAFLTALAKLNGLYYDSHAQRGGGLAGYVALLPQGGVPPGECVVIEDSVHGVMAARSAGMKSVAVTNSYPKETLQSFADYVVDSLDTLTIHDLENLCKTN